MTVKFGRDYRLVIADAVNMIQAIKLVPQSTPAVDSKVAGFLNARFITGQPEVSPLPDHVLDWNHIPPEHFEILGTNGQGLDLKATISQSKSSGTPCVIEVKNLSDNDIEKISKDKLIILSAGYNRTGTSNNTLSAPTALQDHPELFVGQVVSAQTKRMAGTRITKITCGEAITVKKTSKITFSWPPNTTREQVIRDMLGFLNTQGIPLGRLDAPPTDSFGNSVFTEPLVSGYTIKGYLLDEFEKFCHSASMRSYTVAGKIYVEPDVLLGVENLTGPQTRTVQREIPTVAILQVTPDKVKDQINTLSNNSQIGGTASAVSSKEVKGISFSVWLDANITTSKYLDLDGFSELGLPYDGYYQITSVQHKLDFRSNSTWETKISATRIENGRTV